MSLQVEEGQIRLMKNPKHMEGSKVPLLTGSLMINGVLQDVAIWKTKNGVGFNGTIKDPYVKPQTFGAEKYQQNKGFDDNPF